MPGSPRGAAFFSSAGTGSVPGSPLAVAFGGASGSGSGSTSLSNQSTGSSSSNNANATGNGNTSSINNNSNSINSSSYPNGSGTPALSLQTQLAGLRGALEAARLREEKHKAEIERVTKEAEGARWENGVLRRAEGEVSFFHSIYFCSISSST